MRRGLLVPRHAGVYVIAASVDGIEQRAMAACLAAGPGAVVSHVAAAWLWKLLESSDGVHVIVPPSRNPRVDGAVVHRMELRRGESAKIGPVPLTTPPVTLIHLAALLDERELSAATDEYLLRPGVDGSRLVSLLRSPRFLTARGTRTLREILADRLAHGTPESELERRFLEVLRRFRVPLPDRQTAVRGKFRVDFVYRDQRLIVEVDGRKAHGSWTAQQRDRRRQNALEVRGFRVIRFTWQDVTENPYYVCFTIAEALGIRPRSWTPATPGL